MDYVMASFEAIRTDTLAIVINLNRPTTLTDDRA